MTIRATMISTLRNAAFLLLISFRLHAGSLENAIESLGADDFTQREQAEILLRKAGFEALALIHPLLASEDPEIALRARRIHDWIICGIDERMPEDLASDLPRFDTLPASRQTAVIKELAELDPPHLRGLTHLHSRLFKIPLRDGRREPLLAAVEAAMRNVAPVENLAQYSPWPLDTRTRAFLINLAASKETATDIKETYKAWQKQQPDLRSYLDSNGVLLEVELLRAEWDKQSALAFVGEIRSEQAFQILVREFRDWMLGDPELKFDELEETQAIAYLELTFESATPGRALSLFKKLRERVPELNQKLRPERSTPLLALQLWESGKHAEAAETLYPEGNETRHGILFLGQLILDSDHVDFAKVIPLITPKAAGKLVEIMLRLPISEHGLEHAINLSAYLRAQGNPAYQSPLSGESAESLALNLWKNGRDDLCYRVMEEAFWISDESDEWRLSHFPALASAMGRLDDALAASQMVPEETKNRTVKMAYLYRASGRIEEALTYSSKSPKSSIHQLLLIETRNWSALAENCKDERHLADWFACLNGNRETWRGNVPEAEKKSAHLLLMLDEHAALFSSALKSGGAGVSGANYARVLAGDFLISEFLREDIESALDQGNPIPWNHVEFFFAYPDRLPDKEAAVQLALRLAEVKIPAPDDEQRKTTRHVPDEADFKAILFEALLGLRRPDLAKKIIHDTFGENFDPEALHENARTRILKSTLGSAWMERAQLQRLARWELPDSPTIDRLLFLWELLDKPNQVQKVRAIIGLAERHVARLSDALVASLIRSCRKMLGAPVQADEPSKFSKREALTSFSRSLQEIAATSLDAEKPETLIHKILRPEIGERSDAMAEDFAVLDGIARARESWKEGDSAAAQDQLREIAIRIILDNEFRENAISANVRKGGRISSGSSKPEELMMIGFLTMDLPRELCLPATNILSQLCLDPDKIYISKDILEATAQVFALHGDYENACRIYHQFCVLDLDAKFHYNDIETTAYLIELEIHRALSIDDTAEAVEIYRRHHRLLPFNRKLTDRILATLRSEEDLGSEEKLDRIITGFWEEKLKHLPDAKAYRNTLAHWKTSFSDP